MAIEWTAPPALKAEIPRGKPWSYHLPVRDADADVTWHCRVLPLSALEADPASPARITVTVPADLDLLFGELNWQVSSPGVAPETGRIVFRVLEHRAPAIASPDPAADTVSLQSPRPALAPTPHAALAEPANAAAAVSPAASAEPLPSRPAAPSRTSTHVIEVIRGGATVPGLRVEVQKDRSVTIGRGTQLAGHDLDLTGRFETDEMESYCSRKQAEVFSTDDGVFIKGIGTRPLKIVDAAGDAGADLSGEHRWSVGEMLALPGKLRLVLREEPR